MKNLLLALTLSTFATGSWAACPYNLDATELEIQQSNPSATPPLKKFPVFLGSTGSFTLQAPSFQYHAMSKKLATAMPTAFTSMTIAGDKIISNTGIYAIELKINDFANIPLGTHTSTSSGVTTLGYNFYAMKNNAIVMAGFVWIMNSDDTKKKQVVVDYVDLSSGTSTGKQYDIPYSSPNNYKIGVYFDQNAKKMGVNLNGVNQGYISNTSYSIAPTELSIDLMGLSGGYPTSLPSTFHPSMTLITDAQQMSLTYPSGSKDICGNIL
ncbi:MAG: DUF4882 family protein [Acinetobacter sp.]